MWWGPLSSEQRENNVAATAVSDTRHHHAAVEYCSSNQAVWLKINLGK